MNIFETERESDSENTAFRRHTHDHNQLLQKCSHTNESVDIKNLQNLFQGDTSLLVFRQSCYTGSCFRAPALVFPPA